MAEAVGGVSPGRLTWPMIGLACGSAGLIWLLHALYGHLLVQGMYDRTLSLDWLNGIVKRPSQHPLDYYLVKADSAVRGVCLLLIFSAMVGAGLTEFGRRYPGSPWNGRAQRLMVGATLLLWTAFLLEVPLFPLLPYWFWSLHRTDLPAAWILLPAAVLALGSIRFILSHPQRWRLNLLTLIGAGYVLQLAFAFSEGQGVAALSRHYLGSAGHGHLARAATQQRDPLQLVTSYGQLLDTGELTPFPHATRPPGALLFLMGLERLSRVWGGGEPEDSPPLRRLSAVAGWALPLLTYLTLIPLFGVCSRVYGTAGTGAAAWIAPSLYLFMPNVTLMTLHLDQCLFPLLAWACVYAGLHGLDTGHRVWTVGAGLLLYLSLFFSFGLIALAPILLLMGLLWKRAREGGREEPGRLKAIGLYSLLLAGGWLATHLAFQALFGYDAVAQFRTGMAAHQAFKVLDWTLSATLYFAGLDLVEFALWCGLPVSVLAVAEVGRALSAARGRSAPGNATGAQSPAAGRHRSFVLTFAIVMTSLALFGQTAAETGRLWIFLVPLVLITATGALVRLRRSEDGWHRDLLLLCALQFVTVLVLKRHQDFF
jgi:hypothetical protein